MEQKCILSPVGAMFPPHTHTNLDDGTDGTGTVRQLGGRGKGTTLRDKGKRITTNLEGLVENSRKGVKDREDRASQSGSSRRSGE